MKKQAALFTFVFLVGFMSRAFAQVASPNAALEAWEKAMVEWNRQNEEIRQQNAADRELWLARMKEATRPLSVKQKVLIGLAYVGDKLVTGYVNYHSSRAAIRSEMPRFDARFNTIRQDVSLLMTANAALGVQLSNTAAAQAAGNAAISSQLTSGQATAATNLSNALQTILNGQSAIRADVNRVILPPCVVTNPFGPPTVNPQPCRE